MRAGHIKHGAHVTMFSRVTLLGTNVIIYQLMQNLYKFIPILKRTLKVTKVGHIFHSQVPRCVLGEIHQNSFFSGAFYCHPNPRCSEPEEQ